jgi:hypothetical protein
MDYERGDDDRSPDDARRINGVDHDIERSSAKEGVLLYLALNFLTMVALSAGVGGQSRTFTGTITDDMCANGGHAQMRMGSTDAECTTACVSAHGARYVLLDGKDVYALSDQQRPAKLAGQNVRVTGTLDPKTKTIKVESMTAAR